MKPHTTTWPTYWSSAGNKNWLLLHNSLTYWPRDKVLFYDRPDELQCLNSEYEHSSYSENIVLKEELNFGHFRNNMPVSCVKKSICFINTGTIRIWHANTYRLESTLNYGLERAWTISCLKGSNNVALGYDEGSIMIKVCMLDFNDMCGDVLCDLFETYC